jgi:hypothetical protein
MTELRKKVTSVRNKLANMGLEKTQKEIWNQVLDDAGGDEDIAYQMILTLDSDQECLASFASYTSGQALPMSQIKVVVIEKIETRFIEIPVDRNLIFVGAALGVATGFLAGVMLL